MIYATTHPHKYRRLGNVVAPTVAALVLLASLSHPPNVAAQPLPTDRSGTEPGEARASIDIRERLEGSQVITEYRRFGQLYMLKVKPKGAAPLYMIDQYGDGQLNTRPAESIEDDVNLPKWRIGGF